MPDQMYIDLDDSDSVSLVVSNPSYSLVVNPSPDYLILRDETGQTWAISVHPDGQLQTAKWPETTESR
jgi:uncharacterized cupin superfamily protein